MPSGFTLIPCQCTPDEALMKYSSKNTQIPGTLHIACSQMYTTVSNGIEPETSLFFYQLNCYVGQRGHY